MKKLIAYVYIKNTEEVVAKIEAVNREDLTKQLIESLPSNKYDYRIDRRIADEVLKTIWR